MLAPARSAALALLALPSLAAASTWDIDPPHTSVTFSVRHMMVTNVRGTFTKVSGTVTLDDKDVSKSSLEITIDPASVDTRNEKRDAHLRSPDFFDVAKYPTITFKSTKVVAEGKGHLKVTGDLTLHGVTRPVTLDLEGPTAEVKDPRGNAKMGASATTKINRSDYGMKLGMPMATGGFVVSDEVPIAIDVELNKKK
jgi:polyisoprenoid-binding protein YceI